MHLKPLIFPDYRLMLQAFGWHDFVLAYRSTNPGNRRQFLADAQWAIRHCYYTPPPTGNFWYNDGVEWAMEWTADSKRTAWASEVSLAEWYDCYYPDVCDMCGGSGPHEGKRFIHVTGILVQEQIFCSEKCQDEYKDTLLKVNHYHEIMSSHTPWFTVESIRAVLPKLPTVLADSRVDFPPEYKWLFKMKLALNQGRQS